MNYIVALITKVVNKMGHSRHTDAIPIQKHPTPHTNSRKGIYNAGVPTPGLAWWPWRGGAASSALPSSPGGSGRTQVQTVLKGSGSFF